MLYHKRDFGWISLLVLVLCCLSIAGCSGDDETEPAEDTQVEKPFVMPAKPVFQPLLPGEAYRLLSEEEQLLVVDVRPAEENSNTTIEGAISAPLEQLLQGQVTLPEDRPLLLVCAVGGQSYAGGLYLMSNGYRLVYNLRGGMMAWQKAGYPLSDKSL